MSTTTWRLARLGQHVGVIQNFVLLHRNQQHVHLRIHGLQQLIAEIHISDIEGNMLAGFRGNAIVKLFLAHQRQRHALDDDGVAGNGSGHALGLNFLEIENFGDGVGDLWRIHDGTVHNGILRQRFHAVTDQLVPGLGRFQLNGFDGAGTDVQANKLSIFLAPE